AIGEHIWPLLPEKRHGWIPGKNTATKAEIDTVGIKLYNLFVAALEAYNAILALFTVEERLKGDSKALAEAKTEEKDSILSRIPILGWLSRNKDKVKP